VYFQSKQTNVIQVSTIGNFLPDLLVTGDKVSKYTTRPPNPPSHFRAGFVQFYGMTEGIVLTPGGRGVAWGTNRVRGDVISKKVFYRADFWQQNFCGTQPS